METFVVTMTECELRLFSEFLEQKVFENQKGNDILNEWTPDYTGDLKQPWMSDGVEGVKKSRADRNKYQDKYQKSVGKAIQIAEKEGLYRDSPNEKFEHIFNGYLQPGKAPVDFNPKSDAASRDEAEADIAREYRIYRTNTGHYHPLNRTDEVINTDRFIYYNTNGENYYRNLTDFAEEVKSNLPLSPKGKERLVKEVLKPVNPVKKYDPKTDKPLVEIDEDIPIITEHEEEEHTPELVQFQEDRKNGIPLPTFPTKREKFIENVKKFPERVNEKYKDITGRGSLGKDAAIAAGVAAGLGAGAYALHKHLKNKKKNKDQAENKYKTDFDKKKEDKKKK